MKTLLGLWLLVIFMSIVMFGCSMMDWEIRKEPKQEAAVVVDTYHTNEHSDTDLSPTISMSDGSIGLAVNTVTIPEQWGVAFRCQHGKFVSQGSDIRHKNLWQRLDRGMNVIILYEEVYRVYTEGPKIGKKEFVKLDFLNATPVNTL